MAAEAVYINIDINEGEDCKPYPMFRKGMLCVSSLKDQEVDTCSGDSGGPLICNLKLVGLVSYGYGCAAGVPGVYTDVWHYRNWIKENNSRRHDSLINLVIFCAIIVTNF